MPVIDYLEDAIEPTITRLKHVFYHSSEVWKSLKQEAEAFPQMPACTYDLQNILGPTPAFPCSTTDLDLRSTQNNQRLYVTGLSTWQVRAGEGCSLRPKTISHDLLYGIANPTRVALSQDHSFDQWPTMRGPKREEPHSPWNHVPILVLAWSYILSAMWVERQDSKTSTMQCTQNQEHSSAYAYHEAIVDIGDASVECIRWWAAVLAPDGGWKATLKHHGFTYHSPWAVRTSASIGIRLSPSITRSGAGSRPSTATASLGFLADYCTRHNKFHQGMAALAMTLYFPYLSARGRVYVPRPVLPGRLDLAHTDMSPPDDLRRQLSVIPHYMIFSSNVKGMLASVCSTLFNPNVSCNLVSAWTQPVFEALEEMVAGGHSVKLAIVLSTAHPKVAPLALGAILLGLQRHVLDLIRLGTLPVEIHCLGPSQETRLTDPGGRHSAEGSWHRSRFTTNPV